MTRRPYVGVTGFVNETDLATAKACQREVPPGHLFMSGVLVSGKTIAGRAVTNRRYPGRNQIPHLLTTLHDGGCWTVVHYNTGGCQDPLSDQLDNVMKVFSPVGGIQMNVVKPDVGEVRKFHERHPHVRLILQVNGSSIPNRKPESVHRYVRGYLGLVDYALLDMSGGRGRSVDPVWAAGVLDGWDFDHDPLPAIAGGLGPECGPVLATLAANTKVPLSALSFDAEGRVRVPVTDPIVGESYQDTMDHDLTVGYVKAIATAVTG